MSWTLIEQQVTSTAVASVTFSNIPQTYKTLVIKVSSKRDLSSGTGAGALNFNGSGSNLNSRILSGNGSTATSFTTTAGTYGEAGENAEAGWCSTDIVIPNYTGSTNKPFSSESAREANATTTYIDAVAGLWSSTSAITSILLKPEDASSKWIANSSFTLYGLA